MPNKEYIEREAALAFQNELEPCLCRSAATGEVFSATKDADLVAYLQSIPAADMRPVVRAHWKSGDIRNVTAVCSNCGRLRLGNGAEWATKLAYFCEKCGADMRETNDEKA